MRIRFFLSVLLLILPASFSFTQERLSAPMDVLVVSGIDLILKQDYERADSVFIILGERFPEHPAGCLYRAAVMQAYAIDFSVPIPREKFDSLLDCGREKAAALASPWREYFLGTADGYDAYECVERGDWLGGVKKGLSSASKFEELIEKDSSFTDAYVGIGAYYYWRSRKTAFLRWLPFIKDDRELGISLLTKGAERSEYNRFAAMSALVSIYLDAEEYGKAERWSTRGLKSYPENRIFLWGLATALDRQHRSDEAVDAYEHLLGNLMRIHAPHPYDEIVCRLNLVKSKLALQDTAGVLHHLEVLLSYENASFPDDLQSRAQAKFDEARGIRTRLEHQHAETK